MGPQAGSWRRYPSVLLLTRLGAVAAASVLGRSGDEGEQLVQRSYYAFIGSRAVLHDIEVCEFFVSLAAMSASRPEEGLHHWIGEASIRSHYQRAHNQLKHAGDLAPDGWGRYITERGDVRINLEWDRGTETPDRLGRKARGYMRYAPVGEQVLIVLPNVVRERSVRKHVSAAIDPALEYRNVSCWTTSAELLREDGPLGEVWLGFGDAGIHRSTLAAMPTHPAEGLPVGASVGKPDWWMWRPGAGEGTHRIPARRSARRRAATPEEPR